MEGRHGSADAVIDALDIHIKDPVPPLLGEHIDGGKVHNAGVADQNIHIRNGFKGGKYRLPVRHIAAEGHSVGAGSHSGCLLVFFFVKEIDPLAPGGEMFHGGLADAPGTAGDDNSFHIVFP